MDVQKILIELTGIKEMLEREMKYRYGSAKDIANYLHHRITNNALKGSDIEDDIVMLYEKLNKYLGRKDTLINESRIIEKIDKEIERILPSAYGRIVVRYEDYKLKTIMWYENENHDKFIAYMAGSFYTDQEYRTFLANIQKGISNISFYKAESRYSGEYNLRTIKDGYISRVKKAVNQNTQDGYHATFQLDNGRFFLLRENDNPADVIYDWVVANTQAAVLEEWKTYLYNKLVEGGHILECNVINYTSHKIKGIVLDNNVNTETIRNIRYEGISLGEIEIPREPVELDDSMTFIDVMNKFIIPEINEQKTLYKVGEAFSPLIETPIIAREGVKIRKTRLYPRQKVMVQGLLNAVKEGRNNLILNGGMGIGKTYMSIKFAHAVIKEHFNRDYGRIAVYCQGHLIPKWQRQFKEALPDVDLKFIKINNYKDVMGLKGGKPKGIEVYLLPKDRVKRKYLEEFATKASKYELSSQAKSFIKEYKEKKQNIIKANELKMSELKVVARKLERLNRIWICLYKEVLDEYGNIKEYKVVTTSNVLKSIYGKTNKVYDFTINDLREIYKHEEKIMEEYKEKRISYTIARNGLTCPVCGGFIYEKDGQQLSEDEWQENIWKVPKTKSDRNKNCRNLIKADGTPLMAFETKGIIKGEIEYFIATDETYPYYDEEGEPITDQKTLIEIKAGKYKEPYKIALKKCNEPHWTAVDRKGYRTVNSVDMLERKFGRKFLDTCIADESHLYSAQSSQGETFAKLCRMSKINLALTGTLTGGKASHLFYTLYRMVPEKISKYYKYNEVTKFIDHYGRRKKVTKEYKNNGKYNKSGQGKVTSSGWNEIPGISPLLYSHFLSDIMISRKIEDMNMNMPELKFYKHEVPLSPELLRGYETLKDDLIKFMKANKDINLGGTYLNALLSYPDMPSAQPLMYQDKVISVPPKIDMENKLLPKEEKLLETINRELKQGRRVVVYVTYTGTKEIDKRVEEVIKNAGYKVKILKSTINTEKREQWIEDRYNEGTQVIITNPKLVQTGLDIIGYPTLYFYEVDYDVRVVRQAESRAWRPNQSKECRVYYSYYQNTIQFDALKLIGSKKKASLALEGVFAEDILSDMGDVGDSGAAALYKALLGKVKLKEDDLDFFSNEEEIQYIEIEQEEVIETVETTLPTIEETTQLSLFTITEEVIDKKPKRKKKNLTVGQLSLFEI